MKKDALSPLQCDSHLPTTDGTGTDKRNEEIREFSNVLRRLRGDCNTYPGGPH